MTLRSATLIAACMIAASIGSASCRRDAARASGTASDTVAAAASGAETFFRYGLVPIGSTRAQLEKLFGAPDSVTARAVKNRHVATETDSVLVVYFHGLEVELYRVTASGNEFPSRVRVSDNRYIVGTAPIRIGLAEADVATVMGPPGESSGNILVYKCDTCSELGNERIEVQVDAGLVSAVTIYYSFD